MATFSADAVVMPTFSAMAIKQSIRSQSFNATAYVLNPFHVKHDRGNANHHDSDLDEAITLIGELGVYSSGLDLHSVLVGIVERITDLENANSL
jgi:hypothetical protein